MSLFKGYVPTKKKKCLQPFKDVPASDLKTYDEVKDLDEYAGILAEDVILVDIDNMEQSEILMNIVEDLQLNCRVYQTTRGRHFLFKNNGVKNCSTHSMLAIGLEADIKLGCKNSYSILKFDGEERFIEWDSEVYDPLPKWLLTVKYDPDFITLGTGDGRNQKLFNYILILQSNGFTKDECRQCITIINNYVLKDKLDDSELSVILRDDAFQTDIFFNGKNFLFDKFAQYLKNEYHIVRINNQLHIYNDGVYDYANKTIESKMIEKIPSLKAQQRVEVLKYLDLIAPDVEQSEANYIAFKNGIYDIATDMLLPYSPDIILTNRIPHNYIPTAYNELTDKTLDKLACGDKQIRALLEECIGYCFYRRAELGKAFILTGDKSNGKSTFLDLVKHILSESNISALDLRELGDRFSTAVLFGKCANIGDDIGDEFLQGNSVAIFKKIVTGNRVKAEYKGKDPFEFNPYVKLLFSANDMPRMRDKTGAVLRRLVMIPFNATFTKDDPDYDPFIKYKLIKSDSIEYLITLGVTGLKRVLENNEFSHSDKVEKVLTEYEEENNPIIAFVNEYGTESIINQPTTDVYLRYATFCSQNQLQALSKIAFSKQINKRLNTTTVNKRIDSKIYRLFVEV
jgi:putative DNA primase/helicase